MKILESYYNIKCKKIKPNSGIGLPVFKIRKLNAHQQKKAQLELNIERYLNTAGSLNRNMDSELKQRESSPKISWCDTFQDQKRQSVRKDFKLYSHATLKKPAFKTK